MNSLVRDLAAVVGAEHVLTEPDLTAGYTTDWTRRYRGNASCVVRPGSAGEVAEAVRVCARHQVPVVPQGGNTGLVGGSVPFAGGVVLSARRLRRLDPVDTLTAQVTAGAGVTIAELRGHAAAAGLEYGVDLAARDSATVGGTIATNAGGIHTIRYGGTRAQLLGLEAVMADGNVISRLGGVQADNTGYDLAQLLAGSEGTLAVITAARLRLWPAEPAAVTVLAGVDDIEAAVALQAEIRSLVPGVRAAEYFEAAGLALVREHTGLPAPLPRDYPGYLLIEAAGPPEHAERMAEIPLLEEAAVAVDIPGSAALWAYRERHTEAISAAGVPHKLDIAAPLTRLPALRAELDDTVKAASGPPGPAVPPGAAASGGPLTIVFGHIGAGNLHVNVLGPDPADQAVDEAVLQLAAAHGGTISAEHGIGRAKARSLTLNRSPEEIAAMRAIKTALDPSGLLNPGVLFA
ncbi:MAG TPA: FAD-binding oxidoreductase [Streptosporangiaceae bacterium]|nr:FAD-binding oxidoreductase [Streptosporangiaceae bacterium]